MASGRSSAVGDLQPCRVERVDDVVKGRVGTLDNNFGQVASEDACNPVREVLP